MTVPAIAATALPLAYAEEFERLVRPERNNEANTSAAGSFLYNRRVSPFGFNGGFYFTSVKMYF